MKLREIFTQWAGLHRENVCKDIWQCVEKMPQLTAFFDIEFPDTVIPHDYINEVVASTELDMTVQYNPGSFSISYLFDGCHSLILVITAGTEVMYTQKAFQSVPECDNQLFKYLPHAHNISIKFINSISFRPCDVCGRYVRDDAKGCPVITE